MTQSPRLYTTAQAGAVSGLNPKAVQNAIDKRIVQPVASEMYEIQGEAVRAARRMLTADDLVRLRVWYGIGGMQADRRQAVFTAMIDNPKAKTVKADDLLIVDVSAARRQVADKLKTLDEAERTIKRDKAIMGGEPVFAGTRVPVYSIAAMLEAGTPPQEILAGYPSLDAHRLELVRIWAAAHPRRGRPKSLGQLGLKEKSRRKVTRRGDPLGVTVRPTPPIASDA